MDTSDENANNITFLFEDTNLLTGEDNSVELEKMMQEFQLDDDNNDTNNFVSLNESFNDLSYFLCLKSGLLGIRAFGQIWFRTFTEII